MISPRIWEQGKDVCSISSEYCVEDSTQCNKARIRNKYIKI